MKLGPGRGGGARSASSPDLLYKIEIFQNKKKTKICKMQIFSIELLQTIKGKQAFLGQNQKTQF